MTSFLGAVEEYLAPLQYVTHQGAAVRGSQYLVLAGPPTARPDEEPLSGPARAVDTMFRVTAVTGTVEGARIMLDRVRDRLSPGLEWTRIPLAGWALWVRYERSEALDVDTSTTITDSNRHPAYGVDTYRLAAEML